MWGLLFLVYFGFVCLRVVVLFLVVHAFCLLLLDRPEADTNKCAVRSHVAV